MAVPRVLSLALAVCFIAECLPVQAESDIYVICDKNGKPSPATAPKVVSNKMGEKFAEVTVTFGHPQSTNNKLGCATLYRIELMDGNKVAMRENGLQPANPLVTDVTFTRRLLPGSTFKYRITAINSNTNPRLESEPALTEEFTTANGPAAAAATKAAPAATKAALPKPVTPAAKP